MNVDQLVQGVEDTTIELKDLSGYELFILCKTKLVKTAAAEAKRRLLAKGLKQTPYGWLDSMDIAELNIVFKDGKWSTVNRDLFKNWAAKKKREREAAYSDRQKATQATLKIGP